MHNPNVWGSTSCPEWKGVLISGSPDWRGFTLHFPDFLNECVNVLYHALMLSIKL